MGAVKGQDRGALLILFGIYAGSVALYVLLGSRQELPHVTPDEFTYSALARSLADGDGLTLRGESNPIRAALYLYLIAPAWRVTDSITDSLAIAKGLSAAMCSLVVFPTWLLARRYVSPLLALLPAALVVAGTWMTQAGQLLTENLAYPLCAASLAALVVALAKPGSRYAWLSLAFALAATLARLQLAILIVIIFVVFAADAAALRERWRERAHENRLILGVTGAACLLGGAIVLSDPSVLAGYEGVKDYTSVSSALSFVPQQSLAFLAMGGILPLIAGLAMSARKAAWEDPALRALQVVLWTATALFLVQAAWFVAAYPGVDWSIQRYVEYSLPLAFVWLVVGVSRGLLTPRALVVSAVVVGGLFLFVPEVKNVHEQSGMYGLELRGRELLGISPGLTVALLVALTGSVIVAAMRFSQGRSGGAVLLGAIAVCTFAVFAVQGQAIWQWHHDQTAAAREGLPQDLQWLDHGADEPVARLVALSNPERAKYTEFFNRNITQVFTSGGPLTGKTITGKTCRWGFDESGSMRLQPGCGPVPSRFLLNDDFVRLTFAGQRVAADHPGVGRVVELKTRPPARARVKAFIVPLCLAAIPTQDKHGQVREPRASCSNNPRGQLWLDRSARMVLRFRGGTEPHVAKITTDTDPQPRTVALPAGKATSIALDMPAGRRAFTTMLDWQPQPDTPRIAHLEGIELHEQGAAAAQQLLY